MNIITRTFAIGLAAFAVLASASCASTSTSKHERTGEYFDDSVLTTKVKAAIFNEPNLKSAEINVETYKGVVQLTGFVSTRDAIDKAAAVARGVAGVKSVKNDMHVKS